MVGQFRRHLLFQSGFLRFTCIFFRHPNSGLPVYLSDLNCLPVPSGSEQSSRELHTLSTGASATFGSFFFLLRRRPCSVLRRASFYRNQRGCLLFAQTLFPN